MGGGGGVSFGGGGRDSNGQVSSDKENHTPGGDGGSDSDSDDGPILYRGPGDVVMLPQMDDEELEEEGKRCEQYSIREVTSLTKVMCLLHLIMILPKTGWSCECCYASRIPREQNIVDFLCGFV